MCRGTGGWPNLSLTIAELSANLSPILSPGSPARAFAFYAVAGQETIFCPIRLSDSVLKSFDSSTKPTCSVDFDSTFLTLWRY